MSTQEPKPNVTQDDPGLLGMRILLASLTMIFLASLIGYLVIRSTHGNLAGQDLSGVMGGLWLSTIVLLISGGTMQWAVSSIRAGNTARLSQALVLTLVLGVLFLALQGWNWTRILGAHAATAVEMARVQAEVNLAKLAFFMLAGLHAVHVVGGIVPLIVVTKNAYAGLYTAENHPGVTYTAMYWHFLDVVWIVLFAVLFLFA